MKQLLFVLVCFFVSLLQADTDVYATAHKLWRDKKYEQALAVYDKIEPKSSQVWYEMSQCAKELEDLVHAQVYALRAGIVPEQNNSHGRRALFYAISHLVHPLVIQIILLLLLSILLYIVVSFHFVYKKLLFFLIVFIILFGMVWHIQKREQQACYIVCAQQTDFKAGPADSYHSVGVCTVAQVVLRTKKAEQAGWVQVQSANQIGWMRLECGIEV